MKNDKITYKDSPYNQTVYIYKNNRLIAIQDYNGNIHFEECYLISEELQKVIEILQNKR